MSRACDVIESRESYIPEKARTSESGGLAQVEIQEQCARIGSSGMTHAIKSAFVVLVISLSAIFRRSLLIKRTVGNHVADARNVSAVRILLK